MRQPGLSTLQHYWVTPLVMARMWDQILAYAKPDEDLVYPIGVWHYARPRAVSLQRADAELAELQKVADDPAIEAACGTSKLRR